MSSKYVVFFFVEAMKKTKEDESMFSESSEEELLADSPKLQRTNARRFGKVSYEKLVLENYFCLWCSSSVVSYFFELFFAYFFIYV